MNYYVPCRRSRRNRGHNRSRTPAPDRRRRRPVERYRTRTLRRAKVCSGDRYRRTYRS